MRQSVKIQHVGVTQSAFNSPLTGRSCFLTGRLMRWVGLGVDLGNRKFLPWTRQFEM